MGLFPLIFIRFDELPSRERQEREKLSSSTAQLALILVNPSLQSAFLCSSSLRLDYMNTTGKRSYARGSENQCAVARQR